MVIEQTKTKRSNGEKYQISAKCKNRGSSPMSNLSWCDLIIQDNLPKVHNICPSPECKCQKQNTFTPYHFQVEGFGYKNALQKIFNGIEEAWNLFLKPAFNTIVPVIGMAIGAKSKNPAIGEAISIILKSKAGGRFAYKHAWDGIRIKSYVIISNNLL